MPPARRPMPRPRKPGRPARTAGAAGSGASGGAGRSAPEGVRLQKLLAGAGIASRRRSEDLIRRGLVTVDGRTAVLGERVDPATAVVEVEGRRVSLDPGKLYYALNKPAGVVTTRNDPQGRRPPLDPLRLAAPGLPVCRL